MHFISTLITRRVIRILLLLISLTSAPFLFAQQPSFPGAEGAGMYTTGGRGTPSTATTVFEVTNLNDDNNPGSLRYALQASQTTYPYRTIVFRVSGTIHLLSKLNIRANTTIAGQTAPGDGICTADYPVVISGDNVIVRYMRFRMGDKNQNKGTVDGSGGDDSFGGTGVSNVMVDHCSVSWSDDECLTIYRGDNLTIQWCFITEPLNYSYHFETGDADYEQHGYGGIWGAKRGTMHHNLFADCRNRNPRFAGISTYTPNTVGVENVDLRNNIIYNWGINTVYAGEGGNYNVVNNYYKYGPSTSSGVKYRICNPGNTATIPYGKWFVDGNYVDGSPVNTANNWSGVVMSSGIAADTAQSKVTTPFNLGFPITTQTATDAYDSILKKGGCTLPNRDTLDQRIVSDVRNRIGRLIDVQGGYPHGTVYSLTVNAWPTLQSTAAPTDTDHDGMPDSWETANGLNPNDASDRNGYAANGYTNLENYLNNIVNTNPAIAVSGSLTSFSQTTGTPSAAQTFTVSGSNLTGDITLTPPANYELSLNGTTWSTSAITLAQSGGAVAATTVSARLNAAAAGAYAGNIVASATGALSIAIAVSGTTGITAPPPAQGQIIGSFPDMDGGFEKQTIGSVTTVSAHTSTTKWEASSTFNIADTGARTGALMLHWTGASTSTKYLVSPVLSSPVLQQATSYVVQFWYKKAPGAAAGKLFLNGYSFITGGLSGSSGTGTTQIDSIANTDPTGGWTMFKGLLTTQNVAATSTYGGIKVMDPQTPFFDIDDYVVYPGTAFDVTAPGAATGGIASGSSTNNNIGVSWTAPATGVDGGGFVVVRSTSSIAPTPNANGVYVAGNTMGAGNTVVYIGTANAFTDDGSIAALSPTNTYYYYIFTADKAFNYSAALPVTGSISGATPVVNTSGSPAAFSQTIGAPSASQSFTLSGSNLSGNITLTAPAGFELSEDDNTWSASLIVVPAGGAVNEPVFTRLNATSAGNYSGNITIASSGAAGATVALSGTASAGSTIPPGINVIVAKDGSGNYTSIQAAITAAPTGATSPYRIYIKKGKYVETVIIPSNKPFIQLMGESVSETILSYDNYSGKAKPTSGTYGTADCATLIVSAADVMVMNLSIENAVAYGIDANAVVPAPGDGPQAVAVYTTSDRVVFYNVRMNGGQDTYYGGNNPATRCYLKNCYIDGNTDFMFGSSTIIFDTCVIYPRTRLDAGTGGYVTAVNTKAASGYGYVFRDCKVSKNRGTTLYTLGRPWQNDANTADGSKSRNKAAFLNTLMGASVTAPGWSTWDAGTNTGYITYAEYNSRKYDGSTPVDVSGRVSWSQQLTAVQAAKYYNNDTVFMNANTPQMAKWDPYATWPELGAAAFKPELVVSNLVAKKGSPTVSTSTINWNLSWPMSGIKCDLYRTADKTNYTLVSTQTSTEDSACNFSFSENIPPPGQTYYYIVKASKAGYTSITSDTTSVVSTPTITATGTLSPFLQGLGTPSATQAYLVSGANLTTNITVTPPAGYEVSADNTNWFSNSNPLILVQSGGVVANTNVSVRLNATVAGSPAGNIVHTSTGATAVNMTVSGTVQTAPLVTNSAILEQWPLTTNNTDSAAVRAEGIKSTTPILNRLLLADGITVPGVPAYSPAHGQSFGATADGYWTTGQGGPGSTLNRTYYEQFTVVTDSVHTLRVDSILLSSAFLSTSSGTKLALVFSASGFRSDSTEAGSVSLNGIGLTGVASGNFVNSFSVNNLAAPTDKFAFLLNGSTGITVKAKDTLSFRIYHCTGSTSNGRYAQLANVLVKGFSKNISAPSINATGALSVFIQRIGAPSAAQTYIVSGQFLAGNIIITPPAGYEISATGGAPWFTSSNPLLLTPASGSIANTTITVRLNATAAGTFAGNIVHTGTGATAVNIAVTGTAANRPVVAASSSTLSFTQTMGAPSAAQLLGVQGNYLTGNLTIAMPYGFEVSLNNSNTWLGSSLLVLTPSSGVVNVPDIRVRLNASFTGTHAGPLVIRSDSAVSDTVIVSGYTYGYLSAGPNPAHNVLTIYHPSLTTTAVISIYDIHGVKYGTGWQTQPATTSTKINIGALPAGEYIIEFRRLDERTILRFVKQ